MLEQLMSLGPIVIAAVMALNLFLSGLHKALEIVKDIIPGDADNKLWAILGKVLAVLQRIIDYIGMNRAHK